MKDKKISEIISEIDDNLIIEASEHKPKNFKKFIPYIAIAACLALVLVTIFPHKQIISSSIHASLVYLSPQEIFESDTVIFKGTVKSIKNVKKDDKIHSVVKFDVEKVYRGDVGESIKVFSYYALEEVGFLWNGWIENTEHLDNIKKGAHGIFMVETYNETTNSDFTGKDVADAFFSDERFMFIETENSVTFSRHAHPEIIHASTLDEIDAYVTDMVERARTKNYKEYREIHHNEETESPEILENDSELIAIVEYTGEHSQVITDYAVAPSDSEPVYTDLTLKVLSTIKGENHKTVTVRVAGGSTEDLVLTTFEENIHVPGERGMIYLNKSDVRYSENDSGEYFVIREYFSVNNIDRLNTSSLEYGEEFNKMYKDAMSK